MDAYEAAGKEAGRKLYKNVDIKQVTTPHETPTIRTLASQKLYKFYFNTWIQFSGTTSTNLHTAAV